MKISHKIISVICVMGAFVLGCMQGQKITTKIIHTEAVRINVAEWVADEDGNPQFKWKYQEEGD